MRTGLCNGIVFHDFDVNQVDVKGLFYFIEQWFIERGYSPNRAEYQAEELPEIKSTKTFKHAKRSLERINFCNIENYFLMHTLADGSDGTDFIFYAGVNTREKCLEFMFDNNEYKFTQEHVNELMRGLLHFVKPRYGYVYQKDFSLGPVYYNVGMIYGNKHTDTEETLINKWFYYYGVDQKYQTGQYRDIYPYNIICEKHLEQEVEGKKLADWISGDPRYGTLTQLKENLWIWHVFEENISIVREALRPTGQVICI